MAYLEYITGLYQLYLSNSFPNGRHIGLLSSGCATAVAKRGIDDLHGSDRSMYTDGQMQVSAGRYTPSIAHIPLPRTDVPTVDGSTGETYRTTIREH